MQGIVARTAAGTEATMVVVVEATVLLSDARTTTSSILRVAVAVAVAVAAVDMAITAGMEGTAVVDMA